MKLPANLASQAKFTLTACADARRKLRERNEKNNCATSKPVLVTEPGAAGAIQGAVGAHLISLGKAALYLAQEAAGDPALPAVFGSARTSGQVDDHAAAVEAAALFPHLSPRDRRLVAPYFFPSAFRANVRAALSGHARASAHAAATSCAFFNTITGKTVDVDFAIKYDYTGVPAAGNKAVVWYEKKYPQDRAAAEKYAAALTDAWPVLTKQFKEPLSDAGRTCMNAGDGRFDVYINDRIRNRAQVLPVWIWNPRVGNPDGPISEWGGCTNTPAYMEIRSDQPRWAVAHELMHAIQFAYTYKACEGYVNAWWDEGSATWAGDFVYPTDDASGEHEFTGAFTSAPAPIWRLDSDYQTWVFWYFLTKMQGVGAMNSIFGALAGQGSRAAVNSAISGGYAKQYPAYLQWLWNAAPVGDPGFPVAKSYLGWDRLRPHPAASSDTALKLTGPLAHTYLEPVVHGAEARFCVPLAVATAYKNHSARCLDNNLGPQGGVYAHFTLPDSEVRAITFTNAIAGKPGAHVDAWMRLADGTWKVDDWSGAETKLCRDTASENVQELYVVSSNVSASGDGFPAKGLQHAIEVRNTCPFPTHFDGTWTRVYTWPSRGSWKETVTGTISYIRSSVFPPEVDAISSVPYDLVSGQVTWTVEGSTSCSRFSGSGGEPATNQTSFGTPTDLSLEKVTGHAGAPDPEPKPYYYAIRIGQDPLKAPLYNVIDTCGGPTVTEGAVLPYLDVGYSGPLSPDAPLDKIIKSDSANLLEGHLSRTDASNSFQIDDTWSLKGSS